MACLAFFVNSMEEWKEYKLGDFMEFNPKVKLAKNTLARKITMDQLIPHCRDIHSWTFEPYTGGTKFKNGDTIMARITPCLENGKHAYISCLEKDEVAYGSTEYIVIRGRKDISDNDFVYYLSHFPDFKNAAIKSLVGTSGRQRAQVDVLENLKMYLPPLSTQRQIASILSSLDDKIELNRKINANLEAQAQALFKSWFVDFEPFKDQPFVESELGMIPKGWKVGTLGEIIDIKYGKDHKKLLEGCYPVYGSGGLMRYAEKAIYSGESVLIPRKGTLNNVMYVNEAFWTVDTMFYSIPRVEKVMLFVYIFLCNRDLSSLNAGSAVPSMTTEILNNMKIIIPSQKILNSFNDIASTLYSSIKQQQQESRRLASLRDALLPRLMSGELKVNEIVL